MSNKLVIKESEWGQLALCNADTLKKCCLGFWVEQFSREPLFERPFGAREEKAFPSTFPNVPWEGELIKDLTHYPDDDAPKELSVALAGFNDTTVLSLDEKKRLIALGFAQIGLEVEFIP